MDVILNHAKTMNFQSFIFFLDSHPSGEATQKLVDFIQKYQI
jgi:hypothetical protein